jgi:sorting nexin-8
LFETTRAGVKKSAEIYINLCTLLDRLAKRNEGLAADHGRLAASLQTLTEASADTYKSDASAVGLLNEGLTATSRHLTRSKELLEDEARGWDLGVLEDLKRQRDELVSMRELFERRDRLDTDSIPKLQARIARSEEKLRGVQAKPAELVKPGEAEKIQEGIVRDKADIVRQHARRVLVKECLKDECAYFMGSQGHVRGWNREWAQERTKYAELQADCWRALGEELEGLEVSQ